MPRANKESTLARQWELMMLIPSHRPGKSARELHESLRSAGFKVTKRNVERDLNVLSEGFPLATNEISQPQGWYWRPGARLTIPGMDLAEAVSLGLLEDLLRQLVPPTFYSSLEERFAEARDKLASLPNNPHSQWTHLVRYIPPGVPFLPPKVSPSIVREVQDALLEQRQLIIHYTAAGADQTKKSLVHPLALVQHGARAYLLATAFDYDIPIYYALHRMSSASATEVQAQQPEGFSLEAFMSEGGGQFGGGEAVTLKATLSESLADLLMERPLSHDQKITYRQGKRTLTVTVVDSWQLRFWVLSQGPSIIVQQPKALRKDLVAQLEQTLAHYSDNQLPL